MEGEKPSAYFLGLEKRRAKNPTITALRDHSGQVLITNKEILDRQRSYFDNIYQECPDSLNPLDDLPLTREDVPKINDLSKLLMDRPFSSEEFLTALKSLNKGRSPRSDGLTPEFYQQFWEHLKIPFMTSILFSMEQGTLSEGQRTGLIKLIPKKELD